MHSYGCRLINHWKRHIIYAQSEASRNERECVQEYDIGWKIPKKVHCSIEAKIIFEFVNYFAVKCVLFLSKKYVQTNWNYTYQRHLKRKYWIVCVQHEVYPKNFPKKSESVNQQFASLWTAVAANNFAGKKNVSTP